jgi:hypothetical protein
MKYLKRYNETINSIDITTDEVDVEKLLLLELEDVKDFIVDEVEVYGVQRHGEGITVLYTGKDKQNGFSITIREDLRDNVAVTNIFRHDANSGIYNSNIDHNRSAKSFMAENHISKKRQEDASKLVSNINRKFFDRLAKKYDFVIEEWEVSNDHDYIPANGSMGFEVGFDLIPIQGITESIDDSGQSITSDDIKRIMELNLEGVTSFSIEDLEVGGPYNVRDAYEPDNFRNPLFHMSPMFKIHIEEDFQNNEEISELYNYISNKKRWDGPDLTNIISKPGKGELPINNRIMAPDDRFIMIKKLRKAYGDKAAEIVTNINNYIFHKISRKYDFRVTHMSCSLHNDFMSSDTIREEGDEKIIFNVMVTIVLKQPIDINIFK